MMPLPPPPPPGAEGYYLTQPSLIRGLWISSGFPSDLGYHPVITLTEQVSSPLQDVWLGDRKLEFFSEETPRFQWTNRDSSRDFTDLPNLDSPYITGPFKQKGRNSFESRQK